MRDLTKRLAALTPEKREIFLRQMRKKEEDDQERIPRRASARDVFPLSFAQSRLWFLNQLEPDSPFYTMFSAFQLRGPVHKRALEESLKVIVQRHEMLRTTFGIRDEEAVQVIVPDADVQIPVIDLIAVHPDERAGQALALLEQEARYPFDLARGPLLRVMLLQLGEQEHILALTMHHIISDGWSMGVLVRELTTIYQARLKAEPDRLPALPIQYADYADWQRQWLQGDILQQQLTYWQQQLADAPALLNLPLDYPRPAAQNFVGERQHLLIPTDVQQQLNALSQREGATLFMTLLAALQTLVSRYSGQEDIVVGSPIANRTRSELNGLIGFFVNTLVLRTDLSGDPSFVQLLARVREMTLQAYAHQDLPFERLLEALQIERTLSHAPLFQVLFALQNVPPPQLDLGGLVLEPVTVPRVIAKFDLSVIIHETDQGLLTEIEYNTDIFTAATIQRLLAHWDMLLKSIVAEPQAVVATLPILTSAEKQLLLIDWNETAQDDESALGLHQLFEAQVRCTPDSVAAVCGQQQLTYGELDRWADQLAALLQRRGVMAERCVGVYMERSLELLIAILGIFKAGGVYVPLDTTAPAERLRWMVDDIQPVIMLSQSHLQADLMFPERQLFNLDSEWQALAAARVSDLIRMIVPEQLAYVIYTSGSTGRPKGVTVTHHAISHSLQWMQRAFCLQPGDRMLQHTPLNFDASLWELVWPLFTGAKIVLSQPGDHKDSGALCALLVEQEITIVFFVPSFLQYVLEEPAFRQCTSLRQVLCGGEVLSIEMSQRLSARHPAELYNLYGPTEAAIQVSWQKVDRASYSGNIPIGHAIANTRFYLLDAHHAPVPIGVVGELYVGGDNLARGYLGRPDVTAERFVPDPWSQQPGARLYQTGDLARYRVDGALEYVSRLDDQIKLHGVRIELAEIQAILNQHPVVQESLVLVTDEVTGEAQLVAYLLRMQSENAAGDLGQELRIWAGERLPAYMVPTYYVSLDVWPLSINGKIDRRALPAARAGQVEQEALQVAAGTTAERLLADIWSKALGLEQVSIHDNFFRLGGDSIISIQIVARARQAGLQLTPKQLFQYQTIAQLATVVLPTETVVPEPEESLGPVPLTPIQHWFFEQQLPRPDHFNQSILVQLPRSWKRVQLQQVVDELYRQYDVLRYRYTHDETGWQQSLLSIQEAGPVHVALCDLSDLPLEEQRGALEVEANRVQASLDLQHGPLWRGIFFQFGQDQAPRFLLVVHHLLVDGVSWRILLEDLQQAMSQLQAGSALQLAPRTATFQRWSNYLQTIVNTGQLRQEQTYWLDAAQYTSDTLPHERAALIKQPSLMKSVNVSLTVEETHQLLHEALGAYHSQAQELLLTALLQTLAQWAGITSIRVDMEGHGREEIGGERLDISRTIGWFTSLYPILFCLPHTQEAQGRWIKTIKEQIRAVPNKGIGYSVLRYLSEERELRTQLQTIQPSEVSFNYLGQFDQTFERPQGQQETLKPAQESAGSASAAENARGHLLEINALVVEAHLHLTFTYNEQNYRRETMKSLIGEMTQKLRLLLLHCLAPQTETKESRYTPSDFPLARLTQKQMDHVLASRGILEDVYPLTPMQNGILFHTLYAPESGVYVEQMSCVIEDLDQSMFVQAWNQLISRTPILRTSFIWQDLEEPLQLVHVGAILPLTVLDWHAATLEEQQVTLAELLRVDRLRGFDVQHAPLLRLTLVVLSEHKTLVLWSHHHLLLDGWSMGMLLQEVLACYQALLCNTSLHLEQRRPYRDYVAWLQQQEVDQAETYWRRYLTGFQSATPLGVELRKRDGSGDSHQSRYVSEKLTFSKEVSLRWQQAARDQQITLNTLMQGAWALVLACYSNQRDVVFGTVVAGRPPELGGMERMLGLFINTVPVRIDVADGRSIQDWLQLLQAQLVEQRQYEYTPLTQVQGWSDVPRDQSLFESLLVFENYPVEAIPQEQGMQLLIDEIQVRTQTHYPLTLVIVDKAEISLRLSYDEQSFEAATIQRILKHIQSIVEQLVQQAEQPLASLSLLTPAERQYLLIDVNRTRRDYVDAGSVHILFEEQVARTPDAIALVYEEQWLTYATLNERANQLAHMLRKQGVGADVCVGISMERSLAMIVAVLGVLKAGGAYVPLDPTMPVERLRWLLEDAQPALVISQVSPASGTYPSTTPLLSIDDSNGDRRKQIDHQPVSNPSTSVTASDLAYILYTSGSTGKPKGVMIEHRNLHNYVRAVTERASFVPGSVFLMLQPLHVDSSLTMLFPPLISGGVLHLISKGQALDAQGLGALLARYPADYLKIAPSHLSALIQASGTQYLLPQRGLIVGGEGSQSDWVQDLQKTMPAEAIVYNHYGPTETTVGSLMYQVEAQAENEAGKITPIGLPLANTQVYVFNSALQPVPAGVIGELYIGGSGLARGYVGRPDLTAALFVPHPALTEPGARLYRTGDLVRMRADGSIEFVGRGDDQVKIRGYRIELGEIEAVLRTYDQIRDTVVLAQEAPAGGKRLVAFLASPTGEAGSSDDLQQFLRARLPEPMIPTSLHWLEALPLTQHGKVDRLALRRVATEVTKILTEIVVPRTTTEKLLAEIWQQVLQHEQVGIHDNFFDLGGHSLLITQVISRVRSTFQMGIPLRSLFDAPTIEQLALVIEQEQSQVIERNKSEDVLDILSALEGLSEEELQLILDTENIEE